MDWQSPEARPETPFEFAGKISFLAGAVGLAAGFLFAIAAREVPASGPPLTPRIIGERALAGPYQLLGWAVLAGFAGFLLLEAVLFLLRRRGTPARAEFGPLGSVELRALLGEVRTRIEALLVEGRPGATPRVLDELLRGALQLEASDIHISPAGGSAKVTYRVHGSLYVITEISSEVAQSLGIRIKVLAQLETYGRKPQDGRLRHQVDGVPLEARVSALPADTGERIVLRLVRGTRAVPELGSLGLSDAVTATLKDLLSKPQGMIFLSGPVGSGKTTTLYSALQHIAESRGQTTAIVSLEDPIELKLAFASQIQINPKLQMGFAQALRSVLRQDPNVIMVGEIRDQETAEIATQAGMTGHLILTTIHVDSAPSTFARLTDMGVEPFVAASASLACVSQRLVRTLCTHCREASVPDELLARKLEALGVDLSGGPFYEARGCSYCDGQGYTGRTPIAEILLVTPEIRRLVAEGHAPQDIEQAFVSAGGERLLDVALALARAGTTSLREVVRVIG